MSSAQKIAEHYFELSNNSDFDGIEELFTDSTSYHSQNTGLHTGKNEIITMQKQFHKSFESLHWTINKIQEIKPGIICIEYDFKAKPLNKNEFQRSGLEYITVKDSKISHIEIRNK